MSNLTEHAIMFSLKTLFSYFPENDSVLSLMTYTFHLKTLCNSCSSSILNLTNGSKYEMFSPWLATNIEASQIVSNCCLSYF